MNKAKKNFSKYGGAFAFVDSARKGDYLGNEYVPYTTNRILSGSNIALANLINEVSTKTVGKEIMSKLLFRYFNSNGSYSKYYKIGKDENKQDIERAASRLSDMTGYPISDSIMYIEKGLYDIKEIDEEWKSIFEF